MWPIYLITVITCLFSGISRCQDAPPPKPVLNSPASQSVTEKAAQPDPPHSSTLPPPPQQHQQPHHHKGTKQQAKVPDTVAQGNGNDPVKTNIQGDLEKETDHAKASVKKQTMKTSADSTPNQEGSKESPRQAGLIKEEQEGEHSAVPPSSQHHHHHRHQQQLQPQQKDSVAGPFSPESEVGKEEPEGRRSEASHGQRPSTAIPDVTTVPAGVEAEDHGVAPSVQLPEAAPPSSSILEPPSQPPVDHPSSSATPAPPPSTQMKAPHPDTQVESPHPHTQLPAKEPDPLTIQSPDQLPPSLALGSGGMVVDDPDLLTPEKVGDEEKELTEDFQTFGEWRKKVLEEELERENEKVKQVLSQRDPHTTTTVNTQKLRVNYASEKCGAKVVTCNPEMDNGNHMLTANKDEYMINPCSAKKWFVIELCEPISVKMVEMASMELFSSQPRSFSLSLTDRYPAKDWVAGGKYEMTTERVPQLFHLSLTSPYVKFVRVDMLDYHGSEHFCPVTLFRVFGLPMEEDDDDTVQHSTDSEEEPVEGKSETLFAKTKATVVSLVKKVLYKDQEEKQQQQQGEGGIENRANFTGEEALPCDPKQENQRLPEKTNEGTQVTVHQPQPTVHAVQGSVTDVPMVTQLQEGEQLEIEEQSKRQTVGGQELVTLLESGRTVGWERALRLCHPGVRVKVNLSLCPSPRCLYLQALLGSPPPISLPRPLLTILAPSSLPTSSRTVEWSTSTPGLEPSFSSPVSHLRLESSGRDGGHPLSQPVHIQPSSDISRELQSPSSARATSAIPDQPSTPPVSNVVTSPSSAPQQDKSKAQAATEKTQVESSAQGTVAKASSATSKKLVTTVSSGSMVETDPGEMPASSRSEADVESCSEVKSEALTGERAESSVSVAESEEVLQPSEKMDTTGVQSPALMRPTPVLEMSAASVGVQDGERDTGLPSPSPSPTSHIAHPPLDSAGFPQILEPTVQEPQSGVNRPDPQSTEAMTSGSQQMSGPTQKADVAVQHNVTQPSTSTNDTEKKAAGDLDLVTVPLSLSAKRESAVMRLTNRIKALELNVSLSSRFLEELSTRFKKQNEEMMKMLNKTMTKFNSTAMASQRQVAHQDHRLDHLETRLDNLTEVVQRLVDNFDFFAQQMSDRQMIFTTVNLLVLVVSVLLCCRALQAKPLHPDVQFLLDTMPRHPPPLSPFPRRNSDLALPHHHSSHLPMATARKKGGSMANLAGPMDGGSLLFLDRGETGPKKKKRKKHKGLRAGSVDTESLGGTESDLGLSMPDFTAGDSGQRAADTDHSGGCSGTSLGHRAASMDGTHSRPTGSDLGHRRSGSATASFFCLADPPPPSIPPPAVVSSWRPTHRDEGGREVQFSLGGQTLSDAHPHDVSVSLPYSLPPPACLPSQSVPTKTPLPSRSQRSKSLTSSPDAALLNAWDSGGEEEMAFLQEGRNGALPPPPPPPSILLNSGPPSLPTTSMQKVPVFPKPKKSVVVMNGDRDSKTVTYDPARTTQRKGSFRGSGLWGEEGRGGGSKGRGGKKPGRGQCFEKA